MAAAAPYVFQVARLDHPAPGLWVVLAPPSFARLGAAAQAKIHGHLAGCAGRSGLAGDVGVAWDAGDGKTAFLGPAQHRAAVAGLGMRGLGAAVKKRLVCSW